MRAMWVVVGVLSLIMFSGAGCGGDGNGNVVVVIDNSGFYGLFVGDVTTSIGMGGGEDLVMTLTSDSNIPESVVAAQSYIYFLSDESVTEYEVNTTVPYTGTATRTVTVSGLTITIEQVTGAQTATTELVFAADLNSFELEATSRAADGTVITSTGTFTRIQ